MSLTAEYLRQRLDYDPETGIFRWRPRTTGGNVDQWNCNFAGKMAGSINGKGYIYISIDGTRYRAHRLAWMYVHGEFPKLEIDHIDRCRTNNRISNLRDVTSLVNVLNRAALPSRSGIDGVKCYQGKTKTTWTAQFRSVHLGTFDSSDDAISARSAAISSFIQSAGGSI